MTYGAPTLPDVGPLVLGATLAFVDWVIVFGATAGMLGVGIVAARRRRARLAARTGTAHDTDDGYLLASRGIPAWAAAASVLATSLSAVTFLGGPELSYGGDLTYLIGSLGSVLGATLAALVLIRAIHRAGARTVYEFLEQRIDVGSRRSAAVVFLVGRVLASGARLYAAALPVALVVFGSIEPGALTLAVISIALVAWIYTMVGGIGSVVWTDLLQLSILVGAAALCAWLLWAPIQVPTGELWTILREARTDAGTPKLQVVDTSWSWFTHYAIWSAIPGLALLNMAAFGTDHDLAQRVLTCRSPGRAAASLIGATTAGLAVTACFLMLGLLLYVHHRHPEVIAGPAVTPSGDDRRVLLDFMLTSMPAGVRGLALAGLFAAAMSSLDSAMAAMAATWANDVQPAFARRGGSPAHGGSPADGEARASDSDRTARIARRATPFVGVALAGCAIAFGWMQSVSQERLIDFALGVMVYAYAGLLGVFLVAVGSRTRGNAWSCAAALAVGFAVVLALHHGPTWLDPEGRPIAIGWRMIAGTGCAVLVALAGRRGTRAPSGR